MVHVVRSGKTSPRRGTRWSGSECHARDTRTRGAVIAALRVTGGRRGGGSAQAVESGRPDFRSGPGPPCCEAWPTASCLSGSIPCKMRTRASVAGSLAKVGRNRASQELGPQAVPGLSPTETEAQREDGRAQGHTASCGREEAGLGPVSSSPFLTARRQLVQGPGTGCLQDSH